MINAEQMISAWAALGTPDSPQQLAASPISADETWVAVDHQGQRHLLLRVSPGTEAPHTETRGLRLAVSRHQVAGGEPADYLDLICVSGDLDATFAAVASDIAAEAGPAAQQERAQAVARALHRWQWFWGVEADRLSERDALGLFAELWYLRRWAGTSRSAISAWTASSGSRHDFQWPARSVEVKAAARRADGAVLHRVQSLEQLAEPETGTLYLFSLRVVRDELARNSLPSLADQIRDDLRGDAETREDFLRKLGLRGFSPAFTARHQTPYRVLGEHLYRIGPGFPRLIETSFPDGLPAGIGTVSYVIDMAACDAWLVGTSPGEGVE